MSKEYKINHTKAWCYFIASGLLPYNAKKNQWCLHHVDTTLRYRDRARYNEWRVEDLVPMLKSEHIRLHQLGRHLSEEHKEKLRNANKGKHLSEETRAKISAAQVGRKILKEVIEKRIATLKKNHPKKPKHKVLKSPEEKGKFWINNGVENKRIAENAEIPAGWHRGRLGFVRKSNPKLGPMSEDHKQKISAARTGMKFTEEHCRHLSEAHKKKSL